MSTKITTLKESLLKLQLRQIYLEGEMVRRGGLLAAGDETYSIEGWERQLAALKEEHSKN